MNLWPTAEFPPNVGKNVLDFNAKGVADGQHAAAEQLSPDYQHVQGVERAQRERAEDVDDDSGVWSAPEFSDH